MGAVRGVLVATWFWPVNTRTRVHARLEDSPWSLCGRWQEQPGEDVVGPFDDDSRPICKTCTRLLAKAQREAEILGEDRFVPCLAAATGISGQVLACALPGGHSSNLHVNVDKITFMTISREPLVIGREPLLKQVGPPLTPEEVGLCTRLWEIEMALLGTVS